MQLWIKIGFPAILVVLAFMPENALIEAKGEIGCYKDAGTRDLDGAGTDISNNTPGKCMEYCRGRGFAYAGVQYKVQCFCGQSYGRYGKVDASQCNAVCPGNAQLKCGGTWRQNIYATGGGCMKGDGRTYKGTKSVTNTGVKCKNWDDALGAQWYWNSQKKWRLLPGDYCRNPVLPAIARGYGYRAAPWCYKEDGKKGEAGGWAYCSIPKC